MSDSEPKNKSNANVSVESNHDPLVALEALLDIKRGSGSMVASNGLQGGSNRENPLKSSRPVKQQPPVSESQNNPPLSVTVASLPDQVSKQHSDVLQKIEQENNFETVEDRNHESMPAAAEAAGVPDSVAFSTRVTPSSSTSPQTFPAAAAAPFTSNSTPVPISPSILAVNGAGHWNVIGQFQGQHGAVAHHQLPPAFHLHAAHHAAVSRSQNAATAGSSHVMVFPGSAASPAPAAVVASFIPTAAAAVPSPISVHPSAQHPGNIHVATASAPSVDGTTFANLPASVTAPVPNPLAAVAAVEYEEPVAATQKSVMASQQPVTVTQQPVMVTQQQQQQQPVQLVQQQQQQQLPVMITQQQQQQQPPVVITQQQQQQQPPVMITQQQQPVMETHQQPDVPFSNAPRGAPISTSDQLSKEIAAPPAAKAAVPAQVVSSRPAAVAKVPLPAPPVQSAGSSVRDRQKPSAITVPPPGVIRSEEIQAALMSKPQRGRKRGNLSELERLELTRTRNREHAKSTRERKKARYQELISNEEKLKLMELRFQLNDDRRQCFVQFMTVRSAMINELAMVDKEEETNIVARDCCPESSTQASQHGGQRAAQSSDSHATRSSEAPSDSVASASRNGHRSITFSSDTAVATKPNASSDAMQRIASFVDKWCASTIGQTKWQDVVADVDKISIVALSPSGRALSPAVPLSEGKRGVAVLSEYDRSTLAFIRSHCVLDRPITDIRYQVAGGEDGVALAPNGVGYANVEVVAKDGSNKDDLVAPAGLVQVEFEKDSNKITSIGWCCPLSAGIDSSSSTQGSSPSLDRLGRHSSFPSVVSLDKDQCNKSKEDEQGAAERTASAADHVGHATSTSGPGMAI